MSEGPQVYIVFGIPGSERRSVIYDLIDGGVEKDQQVLYFRPQGELPSSFDEQLEAKENVSVVDWELDQVKVKHGPITAAPEKIIFLAPGTSDPTDVAEAVKIGVSTMAAQLHASSRSYTAAFSKPTPSHRHGSTPAFISQTSYSSHVAKRWTTSGSSNSKSATAKTTSPATSAW